MVHVQMGQQDVHRGGHRARFHGGTERADARPGVEHERVTGIEADFETRGVAAVADSVGAGRGDRAAATPDLDFHQASPPAGISQNTETTPWSSSAVANSGYAVA